MRAENLDSRLRWNDGAEERYGAAVLKARKILRRVPLSPVLISSLRRSLQALNAASKMFSLAG
jgi:integrase